MAGNDLGAALTNEGFRVDAVAVPDAPLVPDHVVVIVSQTPEAATIDDEVVDDTRLWKVAEDVSALADKGYVLRGFSVAKPRMPVGPMGYVVVMERPMPAAVPSREYRFVRTTGTAGEWKALEKVDTRYHRDDAGKLTLDVILREAVAAVK